MKSVYLIGIGGIGVSSLARYLHQNGYSIFGADPSENDMSQRLQTEIGATVYSRHSADNIPDDCEMVVYSPAVPSTNVERIAATERGITQYTYPEYLGVISADKTTIAVSGTNGKTTTTTMIATALDELGLDPTVIVGGNMPRFGSNFRAGGSDLFVVEACEYKDSFLALQPNIVVMTNISPDHLDYFGTVENYVATFQKFVDNMPADGVLVTDPKALYLQDIARSADARGVSVVDYTQYTHHKWNLSVPGEHNVRNAAAALTACLQLDLETSTVQRVLEEQFETADRRFQLLGMTTDGAPVYDDYAHNVEGLELLLDGVRARYSDKKIAVVFQPHMFSRTQQFFDGFATQLGKADELFLLPIYGAREKLEDFDVTSDQLALATDTLVHVCIDVADCVKQVEDNDFDGEWIVLTVGAGVADQVGKKLVK